MFTRLTNMSHSRVNSLMFVVGVVGVLVKGWGVMDVPSLTVNNLKIHVHTTDEHVSLQRQLVDVRGGQWLADRDQCRLAGSGAKLPFVLLQSTREVDHLA